MKVRVYVAGEEVTKHVTSVQLGVDPARGDQLVVTFPVDRLALGAEDGDQVLAFHLAEGLIP